MDEEQRQRQERNQELSRREIYRKSRDLIRVHNPLNEPFKFMWDGYTQTIPAKSSKDIERYLANHFFRKISQKIIGDMVIKKGEELLDKRKKAGTPDYLDKYAENREVWDKTPRLDNKELLESIYNDVWLGIVEEYGMELPAEVPVQPQGDRRDVYEQIFSQTDKRVDTQLEEEPLPVKAVKPKAEEITND